MSGFTEVVSVPDREIEEVHLPILTRIRDIAAETSDIVIVLLAAPAGAGKTTVTKLWEHLAATGAGLTPVQALPLDGFHYPNSYLDTHSVTVDGTELPLRKLKGAPETFDVHALCKAARRLAAGEPVLWPQYDRSIHDPVPEAITVAAPAVVIEGNFVLLDEAEWRCLRPLSRLSVFLDADEELLRDRLVERKVRGGRSREDARAHYEHVDKANNRRIRSHKLPPDIDLRWEDTARGRRIVGV